MHYKRNTHTKRAKRANENREKEGEGKDKQILCLFMELLVTRSIFSVHLQRLCTLNIFNVENVLCNRILAYLPNTDDCICN